MLRIASLRCAPVNFTAFCQLKSSIVIENCGAGVCALVGTALKHAANALKTASLVKSLLFISTPLTQNLLSATSVSLCLCGCCCCEIVNHRDTETQRLHREIKALM